MDENGDIEGNYSLIGRKMVNNTYGMLPIGVFTAGGNNNSLPVSKVKIILQKQSFTCEKINQRKKEFSLFSLFKVPIRRLI